VTVFLTTQYLEEADVLADRVGIIDHGRIVAEGSPQALKEQIGRSSVEAIPSNPDDRAAIEAAQPICLALIELQALPLLSGPDGPGSLE
jgi:ABC-type multidrug transport system ATPase subunit